MTAALSRDRDTYVITAQTLGKASDAEAVIATLSDALTDWLNTAEVSAIEFAHRIIIDDRPTTGLPFADDKALHVDSQSGGADHDDALATFHAGHAWIRIAGLPGGDNLITGWLDTVKAAFARRSETLGYPADIWESPFVQLGESAVTSLALSDPKWIPAYTDLLALWDLGHEVHQQPTITALFETHGWSDDLRALLIARAGLDSQHGPEQIFGDLRAPLARILSDADFTDFYRDALTAFQQDTKDWLDWPPDAQSQKTFAIDGTLLDIAATMPSHKAGS